MRIVAIAVTLLGCTSMSACGGGGGGGGGGSSVDPPAPTTHVVTATAQTGGTVIPSSATVSAGATGSFTVTAVSGFRVSSVTGCGGSLAGTTYTTGAINGACTIAAIFSPLGFHVDVTGVSLGGLVIENNGSDQINVNVDGSYTFSTGINVGATHSVRVSQQPVTQICRVINGDGVISATSPAVNVQCVNRLVSTSMMYLRTTLDGAGQFQQFLYSRTFSSGLHQFRIRATDGGLDEIAPAWDPPSTFQAFVFSADGESVFADDVVGGVTAATPRDSDGALITTWTAEFGNYLPQLPVPLSPVRPSHDGSMLYRNVTPVVSGVRYNDLWVGTVSNAGVNTLPGAPFALGSDSGGTIVDPTGRYLLRWLRDGRKLEVYRAFTSTTQQPELVHEGTQTLLAPSSMILSSEAAPGKYVYEVSFVTDLGTTQSSPPQIAIHQWQDNGSLTAIGDALDGGALTGEIASEVCNGTGFQTSRYSYLAPLQSATTSPSRYFVQRQETTCVGPVRFVADSRLLGVYLMRVANGQPTLTKLPLDTRPEWSDLSTGWIDRTKLYLASKRAQRVYAYSVDEVTATVQPITGSPFELQPQPVVDNVVRVPLIIMDPTGKFLYLIPSSGSQVPSTYIAAFSVDSTTGALTPTATYMP